ncbi:hypothetical protein BLOT_008863 [Blomia tropicalis]|nr:hypothetical protein BLOT_008863 [Blomia tropicalis]
MMRIRMMIGQRLATIAREKKESNLCDALIVSLNMNEMWSNLGFMTIDCDANSIEFFLFNHLFRQRHCILKRENYGKVHNDVHEEATLVCRCTIYTNTNLPTNRYSSHSPLQPSVNNLTN